MSSDPRPAPLAKGTRITGEARVQLAADLAKRYASGESIRSMAAHFGRSYGWVQTLLKEAGVQLRTRGGDTRGLAAQQAREARSEAVVRPRRAKAESEKLARAARMDDIVNAEPAPSVLTHADQIEAATPKVTKAKDEKKSAKKPGKGGKQKSAKDKPAKDKGGKDKSAKEKAAKKSTKKEKSGKAAKKNSKKGEK